MAGEITRRTVVGAAFGLGAVLVAQDLVGPALRADALPGNVGGLLHFSSPDGALGDVHPYYEAGTWYLYYLRTTGGYPAALATSTDKLNWTPVTLVKSASRPPAQNYFVLGVIKDGSLYRSWYGNGEGDHARSVESTDLVNWRDPGRDWDIPVTVDTYPQLGRDPLVFWDPDVNKYRATYLVYRTRGGTGQDNSVAISTSQGASPKWWGQQVDLVRFPNSGVPIGAAKEPEVPQMFKIGDRWYLLMSLLRQTRHFVGRPSLRIGAASTVIDADAWNTKPEFLVDGECLCAAQVVQAGGKTYLLGWIPSNALTGQWGGHLALPRELYAEADGTLSARLDPAIASSISSTQTWPYSGAPNLAVDFGGPWTTTATTATYTGNVWGIVRIPLTPNRYDLTFDVTMAAGGTRAGALLSSGVAGPWGLELSLDKSANMLRIRWDKSGNGGWEEYAWTPVRAGDLDGDISVRAIIESNMVEFFVNDRYSLAARVPVDLSTGNIRLFAWLGGVTYSNIQVKQLL